MNDCMVCLSELYVKKESVTLYVITLHYSNGSGRASAEHPILWDTEALF